MLRKKTFSEKQLHQFTTKMLFGQFTKFIVQNYLQYWNCRLKKKKTQGMVSLKNLKIKFSNYVCNGQQPYQHTHAHTAIQRECMNLNLHFWGMQSMRDKLYKWEINLFCLLFWNASGFSYHFWPILHIILIKAKN